MVAALIDHKPAPLPVLVEPRKLGRMRRGDAWRKITAWQGRTVRVEHVRDHAADARGAAVQHVIARYLVVGVERRQIAQETGYSERQVQAWLSGRACREYSQAVLERLDALGIGGTRGLRRHDVAGRTRLQQLITAQAGVLAGLAARCANDPRPEVRQRVADARLLLAGREPVCVP